MKGVFSFDYPPESAEGWGKRTILSLLSYLEEKAAIYQKEIEQHRDDHIMVVISTTKKNEVEAFSNWIKVNTIPTFEHLIRWRFRESKRTRRPLRSFNPRGKIE